MKHSASILVAAQLFFSPAFAQSPPNTASVMVPNGGGSSGVAGVTGAAPIVSSGGTAPQISVTAASKADEQGATSSNVTTPAQQQQHDSAAKAWISFVGSSAAVNASYNATVSRTSTGVYVVSFTTAFAAATYVCTATATNAGTNEIMVIVSKAAGNVGVDAINISGGALTDPGAVDVACFGRQ